nr:DUF2577 domain-containing protein [Paenibacillus ginsengarvi]
MLEAVKKAAVGAVDASQPVAVMTGTVTAVDPLEVDVDQRLKLPAAFLLVPESLIGYEVDLNHTHSYSEGTTGEALTEPVVIRRGLEVGDAVLLLRVQGGQRFVVLDRMVQP